MNLRKNKKKWELYVKDADVLCTMLREDDNYKAIEMLLAEQFRNEELPSQVRHSAGVGIFSIDNFYKPLTKLDSVFDELVALDPDSEKNKVLLESMGAELEKKGQISILNSSDKKVFVADALQTLKVGDVLYKDTLLPQNNFLYRYLIINSITIDNFEQFDKLCNKILAQVDAIADTGNCPTHSLCQVFLA